MRLETDLVEIEDVDAERLRIELSRLGKNNCRAILSSDDRAYIQTGVYDHGFVVEKREGGGDDTHFHAVPRHPELPLPGPPPKRSWWERFVYPQIGAPRVSAHAFTLDEVQQIFASYLAGHTSDIPDRWEQGFSVK